MSSNALAGMKTYSECVLCRLKTFGHDHSINHFSGVFVCEHDVHDSVIVVILWNVSGSLIC